MGCPFENDKLTGFFDGELDAAERAEVEKHIATCSECLRELEELKSASQAVRGLKRHAVPEQLTRKILEGMSAPPAAVVPYRRFWLSWALTAAAVVFVAVNVTFFASLRRRPQAETPPQETAGPRKESPSDESKFKKEVSLRDKGGESRKNTEKSEDLTGPRERGSDPGRERGKSSGFFTIVSSDVAGTREFVEDLLRRMNLRYEHGAGEGDSGAFALDTCISLELTEEQLAAIEARMKEESRRFVWVDGDRSYYRRPGSETSMRMEEKGRGGSRKTKMNEPTDPKTTDEFPRDSKEGERKPESTRRFAQDSDDRRSGAKTPPKRRIVIYFHELDRTPTEK